MEVFLEKRAVRQIRYSTADAIEAGDTEALCEDLYEAFPEEQIEAIEQHAGTSDFRDLISELIDEWSGDDVDELFELLETLMGDHGIDLKFHTEDDFVDVDDKDDDSDSDDDDSTDDGPVFDDE
ncbi:hypothetical protein JYT22_01060 [Endomicrobium sp. AH-315-J14]|nr:hypothetical protein [Endomicrobium sp. AH-315-J14]